MVKEWPYNLEAEGKEEELWGKSFIERAIVIRSCAECFSYKPIITNNFGPSGQIIIREEIGSCGRFESLDVVKQVEAGKQACLLFKDRKEGIEEERIANKA